MTPAEEGEQLLKSSTIEGVEPEWMMLYNSRETEYQLYLGRDDDVVLYFRDFVSAYGVAFDIQQARILVDALMEVIAEAEGLAD
jgi:hypothetical protein